MTTAQVVETSVIVNKNSPIQDYVHPDDQTQPTFTIYSLNSFRFEGKNHEIWILSINSTIIMMS